MNTYVVKPDFSNSKFSEVDLNRTILTKSAQRESLIEGSSDKPKAKHIIEGGLEKPAVVHKFEDYIGPNTRV